MHSTGSTGDTESCVLIFYFYTKSVPLATAYCYTAKLYILYIDRKPKIALRSVSDQLTTKRWFMHSSLYGNVYTSPQGRG